MPPTNTTGFIILSSHREAKNERKKHARDHIYKELEISMQEELGRNVKILYFVVSMRLSLNFSWVLFDSDELI